MLAVDQIIFFMFHSFIGRAGLTIFHPLPHASYDVLEKVHKVAPSTRPNPSRSSYFSLCFLDPCVDVKCDYFARCYDGKCVCPACSNTELYMQVCGMDGNSYANECYLRYESCKKKKIIDIAKRESCGKMINLRCL